MLPQDIKASIDRYVDTGTPTGDFLQAVLSNDLFKAVQYADSTNIHCLHSITCYIYNTCPKKCHGSIEIVRDWLNLHREQPKEAQHIANYDREDRENWRK